MECHKTCHWHPHIFSPSKLLISYARNNIGMSHDMSVVMCEIFGPKIKNPYVRNDFGMSHDSSLASAKFSVAKIENSLFSVSHEFPS